MIATLVFVPVESVVDTFEVSLLQEQVSFTAMPVLGLLIRPTLKDQCAMHADRRY